MKQIHNKVVKDASEIDKDEASAILAEVLILQNLILFRAEEYLQVQQHCQKALELLPLQGKRGMAIHQYQECTDILQAELTIAPGLALHRLYEHLINSTGLLYS